MTIMPCPYVCFYKNKNGYCPMTTCMHPEYNEKIKTVDAPLQDYIDPKCAISNTFPTAEEYQEAHQPIYDEVNVWSEPKYVCPKCGGGMCKNNMIVLTSYPAQYEYQCNKCGHIEYQFG